MSSLDELLDKEDPELVKRAQIRALKELLTWPDWKLEITLTKYSEPLKREDLQRRLEELENE